MRYLILSTILSCLPLDLHGTALERLPDEVLEKILAVAISDQGDLIQIAKTNDYLKNRTTKCPLFLKRHPYIAMLDKSRQEKWSIKDLEASKTQTDPTHLLDVSATQDQLFENFLKEKETDFSDSDHTQWRQHVLTSMFTFAASLAGIITTSNDVTESAVHLITEELYSEEDDDSDDDNDDNDDEVLSTLSKSLQTLINAINSVDSRTLEIENFETSLVNEGQQAFISTREELVWNADLQQLIPRNLVHANAFRIAHPIGYQMATEIIETLAEQKSPDIEAKALIEVIQPLVYRLAETQSWMMYLNPNHSSLAKTYEIIDQKMESLMSANVLDTWFRSEEAFKAQINRYFIENGLEHGNSNKFLKPLVRQLERMAEKIFP